MDEQFESFTFRVSITEEDYYQFNVYHALHSKEGKRNVFAYRLSVPIIMACIFAFSSHVRSVAIWIYWLIVSCIWNAIVPSRVRRNVRKSIKRMAKDGQLPYEPSETLTFEADRIDGVFDGGYRSAKKSQIVKVVEQPDIYYIYVNSVQAILIPKRDAVGYEARLRSFLNLE